MITTALCNSFKLDQLDDGTHRAADAYMLALYTDAANLDEDTAAYTVSGEVADGGGYAAGGMALSGRMSFLSGGTSFLDFSDQVWPDATITARGAMIYNATRANKAVAVFDFGANIISTNGNFTARFPVADSTHAILRFD